MKAEKKAMYCQIAGYKLGKADCHSGLSGIFLRFIHMGAEEGFSEGFPIRLRRRNDKTRIGINLETGFVKSALN